MRTTALTVALLATALTAAVSLTAATGGHAQNARPAPTKAATKPNILIIVADDLGYSDLGAFGGEIRTPNLDALAARGLKLTGFHSAPTCSPTRSMLLSGTDNHLAGLGNMAEMLTPNQVGKPGYEGHLPDDIVTLADRLHDLGYATLMAGKWHLGTRAEDSPARHGFDQSFDLAQGGGNHYGLDLAKDGKPGTTYWENGRQLASLPAGFYSSDTYATKLIEQLGRADRAKPFFAYLTFTAPHWPLQAPDEDVARYRGRYDEEFEVLRARRLARLKALGLVAANVTPHDLVLPPGRHWADLSAPERKEQARLMEIYAAMVDRMDQNVGRVIAHLKATGQYDNTIILFTADNGAEGIDIARSELPEFRARVVKADNRFVNLGKPTSYAGYGPGWAQAATAPSWLYKGYTTEGGTRVAAFIDWPGARRHGVGTAYGTVMDVVPTLVEAAGGEWRGTRYAGRAVQPVRGASWRPYLSGTAERVHAPDEAIGSELFGRRAIRQGDWKAVNLSDAWRLFNIADDPGETNDLATREPARLKALVTAWDAYGKDTGVIMPSEPTRYP
ncbi:arylsulfatase [Sphingomonas melonis TY]|uniref:Arylsulfatase n=1 Tax=Sphingomonas melonis TY TaxID=621456 RepID=A0A154NAV5_9SPHN|nr:MULTISPECIES: arylsulfatase [Sphingomonas]AOW23813.1 arylsulfatase [Sphingomonas melonis TY]ATI54820.1 arylsulfatase [Sphingomonas melonis]KZB96796.1 arylsulfatase [Sphingomonas melonis TY]MBX8846119.1 arylsulfatase [Sphingomonas melonis]MBX8855302.1 arylsulfatase [Sphingomonas melonis]